jgi:N-acetylneuraminate synthase/N,N'-diacetyllegionaminate synthase
MTYIIAEIGNAHEGSVDKARELIDLAADTGVDAVKFQMFKADQLVHKDLPARVGGGTQLERMRGLEFEDGVWRTIIDHAKQAGVHFMASVFCEHYLAFASDMSFIKIASGDATNRTLIDAAYATGMPLLISLGCSNPTQGHAAYNSDRITLLHCVSEYPTPPEHAGLMRIQELRQEWPQVGYSDHCCGINACIAAAAMGATVIEKHFTDHYRGCGEPVAVLGENARYEAGEPKGDHIHAATPAEMAELVSIIRQIDLMSGPWYMPDAEARRALERGGYAARDIAEGEIIGEADIIALRPRLRRHAWTLIGSRAQRNLQAGESIDGPETDREPNQGTVTGS